MIPKGHNTGKWRLITDLSFPQGHSVNDIITHIITDMGPEALLVKFDIESAYHLIHLHSLRSEYNHFHTFPLTEQLPCTFAAFLADQGLAPQTIKSCLSAVRNMQISLGLPDLRDQSSMPKEGTVGNCTAENAKRYISMGQAPYHSQRPI